MRARKIAAAANVDVANLNCPGQVVLSGGVKEMEAVPALAKEKGVKKAVALKVAGAYHSRLMASAAAGLAPLLATADMHASNVPVVANATAEVADGVRVRVSEPAAAGVTVKVPTAFPLEPAKLASPG